MTDFLCLRSCDIIKFEYLTIQMIYIPCMNLIISLPRHYLFIQCAVLLSPGQHDILDSDPWHRPCVPMIRVLYCCVLAKWQMVPSQTRRMALWLSTELSKEGHQVALLSGELTVEQRAAVIERFREGKEKVLITTNVCSRGRLFDFLRSCLQCPWGSDLEKCLLPQVLMWNKCPSWWTSTCLWAGMETQTTRRTFTGLAAPGALAKKVLLSIWLTAQRAWIWSTK